MGIGESKRAEMAQDLKSVLALEEKIVMFGGCVARVDRLGSTVTRHATAFVTNKRFGVLSKKISGQDLVEIPLSLISSVEFERNITAAQVNVTGAGVSLRLERMQVNGAKGFVKAIREQIAMAKAHVELVVAITTDSIATQISDLAELQARGVLTADEFAAAKAKLLGE